MVITLVTKNDQAVKVGHLLYLFKFVLYLLLYVQYLQYIFCIISVVLSQL